MVFRNLKILRVHNTCRYSFVDTKEDKVTHRPVLSKPVSSKMGKSLHIILHHVGGICTYVDD